jgi:molybdopterin-binding protein
MPLNEEIANFVGVENVLKGKIKANEDGIAEIDVNMSNYNYNHSIFAVSNYKKGAVKVFLRPEDIILSKESQKSSARNTIKAKIENMSNMGPLIRVKMDNELVAFVTKQSIENLGLIEGDEVYASFKATAIHVVR